MTTNLTPDEFAQAQATGDAAYDAAKTPEEKYDAYRAAYEQAMAAIKEKEAKDANRNATTA